MQHTPIIGLGIDPVRRLIQPIDLATAGLAQIYTALFCKVIETSMVWPNGDVCYVDEEGLMNPRYGFFRIANFPNPLAGYGLIIGTDREGDNASVRTDHAVLAQQIKMIELVSVNGGPLAYVPIKAKFIPAVTPLSRWFTDAQKAQRELISR